MREMEEIEKTEENMTPLQEIVKQLDDYIEDPKLVTRETLMDLKNQIESISVEVDKEDDENEGDLSNDRRKTPSILIAFGKMKKGDKYNEK